MCHVVVKARASRYGRFIILKNMLDQSFLSDCNNWLIFSPKILLRFFKEMLWYVIVMCKWRFYIFVNATGYLHKSEHLIIISPGEGWGKPNAWKKLHSNVMQVVQFKRASNPKRLSLLKQISRNNLYNIFFDCSCNMKLFNKIK